MKKLFFNSILILVNVFALAQNGPPWKPTGNNASTGDFLGTTNNFPLLFYTNNSQKMSLGINGDLNLTSLNGIGNRVLLTDANGNISALPTSVSNAITAWDSNGSSIFFNGGNVGIGTSSPSYKLDVLGDARISNNLYVGGGIVITSKVDASIEVKAGDVKVNNDLNVSGNSILTGNLTASKGIFLEASNTIGINYTPASGNTPSIFRMGNINNVLSPLATCITPNVGNSNPLFVFSGFMTSRANVGLVNSAISVGSATWDGNGIIEVEGTDQLGGTNNGLLVNYFCGRNTLINTNNSLPNGGGTIFMGTKIDMGGSVKIGYSGNTTFDPNTSMEFYNGGNPNWNGIKFITPWNGAKLISISNSNFTKSPFTVYGSGFTQIGIKTLTGGLHSDALLSVSGKIVCQDLRVVDPTLWADFVFDDNYILPSWNETELYFKTNKHLKDMPTTKEVMANGINIAETQALLLKKIEEAYLYIGEMKQEIVELKEMNKELLRKINN